ncbi:hypothetical protein GCM10022254_68230 [Actinomadura meridiana]|uniref:Uncharacterized protein n=1 Tax=Actinomadura meridiana TaxID=559626 RepID=A0ABP8CM39_9ACTN
MVRDNRAYWARHEARQQVEAVLGAAAPYGWAATPGEVDALVHDLQVLAAAGKLKYCAVEARRQGDVVATWWAFQIGGAVRTCGPDAQTLPSGLEFHFVAYFTGSTTQFEDGLISVWRPAIRAQPTTSQGVVITTPGSYRTGLVNLADGRDAAMLPQDARGLTQGTYVDCLVSEDDATGALTAFLVSPAGAPGETPPVLAGRAPRPRPDGTGLAVEVDGGVVLHRPGAAGCPACQRLARGRLRRMLTRRLRTGVGAVTAQLATEVAAAAIIALLLPFAYVLFHLFRSGF